MARRKERGFDIVVSLPWQAGVVLGVVVFLTFRFGGLLFANNANPFIAQLGKSLGSGALEPVAWMALIVCWIGAGASYIGARDRRRLLDESAGLASLAAMHWHDFEELVREAFERQGYRVEARGGNGKDGGIDLILRRPGRMELVQCKQWGHRQVNVKVVREMWGLAQHHGAAAVRILCVGEYTRDAEAFASGKPIELINGARLVAMIEEVKENGAPTARPREQPVLRLCPKCGGSMVHRQNRQNGDFFWGCSRFPNCRGKSPA